MQGNELFTESGLNVCLALLFSLILGKLVLEICLVTTFS